MSFIAVGIGAAGLALSAYSTFSSAGAQKSGGQAQNRAAQIQAAGAQYKAAQSAKIMNFQADLNDWAAKTNEGFALARADRVQAEAKASVAIMQTSTSRAMGRAVGAYTAGGVTMAGSPLMELADIASEGKLQEDLTIYGSDVTAGDIRTQATFDTQKAGMQSAIFRANAALEKNIGDYSAAALRAGGAALESAAGTAANATLFGGLGKTALGAAQLAGGFGGFGGGDPLSGIGNQAAQDAVNTYGTVPMSGVRAGLPGDPVTNPAPPPDLTNPNFAY